MVSMWIGSPVQNAHGYIYHHLVLVGQASSLFLGASKQTTNMFHCPHNIKCHHTFDLINECLCIPYYIICSKYKHKATNSRKSWHSFQIGISII